MSGEPIVRVRPAGLYAYAPYAYASVVQRSELIFTAGACPLDEAGATVAPGDIEVQARQAVRNLFIVLDAAGSSPERVIKTTVYVASTNRADLVKAWNAVKAMFGAADPPSTLLGVAALGYPEQLVEIEAIATRA
ncbi:MAG: RidA family protein [Candidatus Eremiobacteraeota bacterium]|nr:RidA family protein [Candidatus Eremiobacteraeota bacterium]